MKASHLLFALLLVLFTLPRGVFAADDEINLDDLDADTPTEAAEKPKPAAPKDDLGTFDEFDDITTESAEKENPPPPTVEEPKQPMVQTQDVQPDPEPVPQKEEPAQAAAPEPKAAPAPPPPQVEPPPPEIVDKPQPTAPVATASNEPNQALEQHLYQIYLKYQQKQIPDSDWNSIVGEKGKEEYEIQKGNTLWDISQTFFGDGNFWPKIWSMNGEITNPHRIEPGGKIVFVPGTVSSAPQVAVNETENSGAAEATSDASDAPSDVAHTSAPINSDIDIPPPSHIYKPAIKRLPPSFANWRPQAGKGKFDRVGFDGHLKDPVQVNRPSTVAEYAVDEDLPGVGAVVEIDGGGVETAATYQYVFVHAEAGLHLGDQLISFHMKEESDPPVVQVEAELTVTDVINENNKVYKALITHAIDTVRVDSLIAPGRILSVPFEASGGPSVIQANIIGGEHDEAREILNLGEIAFLDKGQADGVKVGDLLSVIVNHKSRDIESRVDNLSQPTALIKIVHVANHYSTALIVEMSGPVYVGDFTGSATIYRDRDQHGVAPPSTQQSSGLDIATPPEDSSSASPAPELPASGDSDIGLDTE